MLIPLAGGWPASSLAQSAAPLSLLTNAQQVLDLGIEGARRAPHPVHLRAVVTYPVINRNWFYAQDDTAGILVLCTNNLPQPTAGELVDVTGQAGPGLQAPHVFFGCYRVIGSAPLPSPLHPTPGRLASGKDFGQWVSLTGNVLDYFDYSNQLSLLLQEEDQHFVVNLRLDTPTACPPDWLGARVEVKGVCWTETRADGVPTAFRIHSPGTNMVTVLRPGSANLFALPRRPIASLTSQSGINEDRVRVVGRVTLSLPGQSLFLRDDTGAIQARLLRPISAPNYLYSINADTLFKDLPKHFPRESFARPRPYLQPVNPGDRVEVVGTPAPSGFGLLLADAEYRRLGPGDPPRPVELTSEDFLDWSHEGDLVTWRGKLIDQETIHASSKVEDLLVLREGNLRVQALLDGAGTRTLPSLPKNAWLQITGVCYNVADELKKIPTFRLLLRGPEDVTVLNQPPPWESWNIGRILMASVVLGVASLAWIGFLRHQVSRQTAQLARSNARLGAEVEERKCAQAELARTLATEKELNQLKSQFVSMVTHEIRTPLAHIQGSSDLLSRYLDRLPEEKRFQHFSFINSAVQRMGALMEDVLLFSKAEAGRMDFNPVTMDLEKLCRQIADEVLSATNRRCPVLLRVTGLAEPARGDENLLRHIFTNLLNNAVKYSPPGNPVEFSVMREGGQAVFTVQDRGMGIPEEDRKRLFTPFHRGKNVATLHGTGLGLVIVKHCVEQHGGQIEIESAENRGTRACVRLPLFSPAHTQFFIRCKNNSAST